MAEDRKLEADAVRASGRFGLTFDTGGHEIR